MLKPVTVVIKQVLWMDHWIRTVKRTQYKKFYKNRGYYGVVNAAFVAGDWSSMYNKWNVNQFGDDLMCLLLFCHLYCGCHILCTHQGVSVVMSTPWSLQLIWCYRTALEWVIQQQFLIGLYLPKYWMEQDPVWLHGSKSHIRSNFITG